MLPCASFGAWSSRMRGALLILLHVTVASAQPGGSQDCPCLAKTSPLFSGFPAALAAGGLPSNYGQEGCKPYDKGVTSSSYKVDCQSNAQPYCEKSFCYVDTELCRENRALCEAAGGTLGSSAHAACRSRASSKTGIQRDDGTTFDLWYSYATCGDDDAYTSADGLIAEFAGRTLQATEPVSDPPFVYPSDYANGRAVLDKERPHLKGFKGVILDVIDDFLNSPSTLSPPLPKLMLNISGPFASERSSAKFPTSKYTACAFDVSLGIVDTCLGSFWVTSQRLKFGVQFLAPQMTIDDLYLIVPRKATGEHFGQMIAKPFLPFQPELWALIVAYIFFSALVTAITDMHNTDDFENQSSYVIRYCKSCYLNLLGYVKGGPENNPQTVPARVATFGFGFFCMIVLTSYTANLASLLVMEAGRNAIESLEDAINADMKICILGAVKDEFQGRYPKASLVETSDEHESLATAHPGPGNKCDAFIDYERSWGRIAAGHYAAIDCRSEAEGGTGPRVKGHPLCKKKENGDPDLGRDCGMFTRVGNALLSIPVSVPVTPKYQQVMSYRLRELTEIGKYEEFKRRTEETRLPPACAASSGDKEDSQHPGAKISSMAGTLIISMLCQLIAIVACAVEYRTGIPIQKLMGFSMTDEEGDKEAQGDDRNKGTDCPHLVRPVPDMEKRHGEDVAKQLHSISAALEKLAEGMLTCGEHVNRNFEGLVVDLVISNETELPRGEREGGREGGE